MKKSKWFILISLLAFTVVLGVIAMCGDDPPPPPIDTPPTPGCDEVSAPLTINADGEVETEVADCISEDTLDSLLDTIILDGALGGTVPDPIPEVDGKTDISFICDLALYGENVVETLINQCELDNLITKLNDFFNGYGSASAIKGALDSFLELITENDTIMNGLKDSIADARDALTAAEIACVGQWASDALVYIACDLEATDGEFITDLLGTLLYADGATKEEVAADLADAIGTLISGFTADAALAVLNALEGNLVALVGALLDGIGDSEMLAIALMRSAENALPTDAQISDAVDEIVELIYSDGTGAISDFLYDTLGELPEDAMGMLASFISASNLRGLIPSLPGLLGMAGTIDCVTSADDMACD